MIAVTLQEIECQMPKLENSVLSNPTLKQG
jgi:hypothetical protein